MRAYSVLTHEHLIDLAWKTSIEPLLLQKFPRATPAQLHEAHAYAYGGSAIQDMGYYPFGHRLFSDLTHYVRAGDFIVCLLRNARTMDEYAFALGALSHYVGDNIGHHDAVNLSTAIEFPSLAMEYGPSVTYDEDPHAHVRTEFAFDIDQLTHHRFAPAAYLRYVGLGVPRGLLERAFFQTYGLSLHSVLGDERPAIRSYRTSVRSFIPRFAYAEAVIHRKNFPDDPPSPALQRFEEQLKHADYENRWEAYRKKPGFETHALALLLRIIPKIGPISDLAIRGPDQHTELLYIESVNRAMERYSALLAQLAADAPDSFTLENRDLDTGFRIKRGAYALCDRTYAELLERITAKPGRPIPAGLRENMLNYYGDLADPPEAGKPSGANRRVEARLAVLRTMPVLR